MLRYVAIFASGILVASAYAQEPQAFDSDQGKSDALGAKIGTNLRDQSIAVTPELARRLPIAVDAGALQDSAARR